MAPPELQVCFMRNDTHDELDVIPGLRAEVDDDERFAEPLAAAAAPAAAAPRVQPALGTPRTLGSGLLWALVVALLIALAGLGWWSHQQIGLMSAQLVATQESFARISEEAAGQIQDISGKVVATESSVTSESESLKLRLKQLETRQAEQTRQLQALTQGQSGQDSRQQRLADELKAQQGALSQADSQLKKVLAEQGSLQSGQSALKTELAALKAAQSDTAALQAQLAALKAQVAALEKDDTRQAVRRLAEDLLVLRGEFESRPAAQGTGEFDAFRAQTTRSLMALQSQMQNLQQQLDAQL